MRVRSLRPEFVEFVPTVLDSGVLYVSIPYRTASHLCACGCGQKVVTPIGPTGWSLAWDGISVSLYPSIGNWGFACQSHYWIRSGGLIEWAPKWTESMISAARKRDSTSKKLYFGRRRRQPPTEPK